MAFTIRLARQDDLVSLGRLGASLMRVHYAFDPLRFLAPGDNPEEGYAWFLGTQLREPDVVVLVAEAVAEPPNPTVARTSGSRDIVGYVYAGLEPLSWKELRGPAGFIHDVVVEEGQRRSGVASALVEAATAWLKDRGAPRVVLWTAAQNATAQRLFSARGFRQTMIEMTRELK